MSAPAKREDRQATEIRRLRKLVIDQGEAVVTLTRQQAALERMLGLQGKGDTAAPAPEPELDSYTQAAAIQARRRAFHVLAADEKPGQFAGRTGGAR